MKTSRRNASADSSTVSPDGGKIVWIAAFVTPTARRSLMFWVK